MAISCSTASTTTMASSTTRPMASTRPMSAMVLMGKPSRGKKAKVPMSDTGTARAGMSVARQPWRNMKTTMMTRISGLVEGLQNLFDALADSERGIERDLIFQVGREGLFHFFHQFPHAVNRLDRVCRRELVETEDSRTVSRSGGPPGSRFGSRAQPGHVHEPHERPVRVGAEHDLSRTAPPSPTVPAP